MDHQISDLIFENEDIMSWSKNLFYSMKNTIAQLYIYTYIHCIKFNLQVFDHIKLHIKLLISYFLSINILF
jgi:hypothetical protein